MDTISQGDYAANPAGVMLVNVVQVNEGQQEAALDVLRRTVHYVAETYPGFRWSRLYRSIDGKTVINQALWASEQEFNSLFSDQSFLDRYMGLKDTGVWEYHLYRLSDFIPSGIEDLRRDSSEDVVAKLSVEGNLQC